MNNPHEIINLNNVIDGGLERSAILRMSPPIYKKKIIRLGNFQYDSLGHMTSFGLIKEGKVDLFPYHSRICNLC